MGDSKSYKEIPLSVPNLDMDILENIKETIESGWVSTGGRFITEFEKMMEEYTGIKKLGGGARSFQSGTAALHLALRALGVEAGDEVIVPTLTFIASVNPVKYLGAEPVFMDCDDTLNMDPIKLEEFLEKECNIIDGKVINKKTTKQIKGIVIVHIFGNPADMEALMRIKEKYNLFLIEDSAEALGSYYTEGKYKGYHCGTIGDAGIYSFNANKIITSGNGGMIVSRDHELLNKVNFWGVQAKTDPLRYVHGDIGYNYRMTNISAAYGVSQLAKIENFIRVKEKNYEAYKEGVEKVEGLELLPFKKNSRANKWFYSLMINFEKFNFDREETMKLLSEKGIGTRPIWGLIHEQIPYQDCQAYNIEKAEYYSERVLNIPCSSNLKISDVDYVIEQLKSISVESV